MGKQALRFARDPPQYLPKTGGIYERERAPPAGRWVSFTLGRSICFAQIQYTMHHSMTGDVSRRRVSANDLRRAPLQETFLRGQKWLVGVGPGDSDFIISSSEAFAQSRLSTSPAPGGGSTQSRLPKRAGGDRFIFFLLLSFFFVFFLGDTHRETLSGCSTRHQLPESSLAPFLHKPVVVARFNRENADLVI